MEFVIVALSGEIEKLQAVSSLAYLRDAKEIGDVKTVTGFFEIAGGEGYEEDFYMVYERA